MSKKTGKTGKTESTPVSTVAPELATTLAIGSRTPGDKPGQGTQKNKSKSNAAVPDSPEVAEPEAATVHDCVGAALLMLPANLRTILGDKDLHSNALELETKELLVIVREAGVVAYVHLPILVKEFQAPATGLSDGVVLLDITGSPPHKGGLRSSTRAKPSKSPSARRGSDAK